ncbi:hypothetical protein MTO96_019159 [Rhipicephalus appendiculatus]
MERQRTGGEKEWSMQFFQGVSPNHRRTPLRCPLCAPTGSSPPSLRPIPAESCARALIPRRRRDSALPTREAVVGARATADGVASRPHARSLATVCSEVAPVMCSQKNVSEHADLVYSRYPLRTTRGTGIEGKDQQQQLATGSLRHLTPVV